jgi:uncharacterized protein with PhoU and TrkA domain
VYRENGDYIGAPRGETLLYPKDTLILYGRDSVFASLDKREKGILGDQEHEKVVEEQKDVEEKQKKEQ